MRFEYMISRVVGDTFDIDDIGNCAIEAYNDKGEMYALSISTNLGWTEILQYGPISEIEEIPKSFSYTYKRIEYSESKIEKMIDRFLNDGYANITQVFSSTPKKLKDKLPDLKGLIR